MLFRCHWMFSCLHWQIFTILWWVQGKSENIVLPFPSFTFAGPNTSPDDVIFLPSRANSYAGRSGWSQPYSEEERILWARLIKGAAREREGVIGWERGGGGWWKTKKNLAKGIPLQYHIRGAIDCRTFGNCPSTISGSIWVNFLCLKDAPMPYDNGR